MEYSPFEQWFREILCRMYRAWGGDCNEMGNSPSSWVETVLAVYAAAGVPTFPDQETQDRFLLDLEELKAGLDDPGNTLAEAETVQLIAMIASLEAALGGI